MNLEKMKIIFKKVCFSLRESFFFYVCFVVMKGYKLPNNILRKILLKRFLYKNCAASF